MSVLIASSAASRPSTTSWKMNGVVVNIDVVMSDANVDPSRPLRNHCPFCPWCLLGAPWTTKMSAVVLGRFFCLHSVVKLCTHLHPEALVVEHVFAKGRCCCWLLLAVAGAVVAAVAGSWLLPLAVAAGCCWCCWLLVAAAAGCLLLAASCWLLLAAAAAALLALIFQMASRSSRALMGAEPAGDLESMHGNYFGDSSRKAFCEDAGRKRVWELSSEASWGRPAG